MKTVILVIFFSTIIYSQYVNQVNSNRPPTEISPGVIQFTKPDGSYYIKRITPLDNESNNQADLVIRFDTLNFSDDKYVPWRVTDNEGNFKLLLADADNNGKKEMYGAYLDSFPNFYEGKIYEYENSQFYKIYQYQDTLIFFNDIGDIDQDGLLDAVAVSNYPGTWQKRIMIYTQEPGDLINKQKTIYDRFVSQFNCVSFFDLDNDNELELIYFLLVTQPEDSAWMGNHVAKFNKTTGEFELVFSHRPSPDYFTWGFSFGDFDLDGKNNFVTCSSEGDIYIYEYVDDTEYRLEFRDTLPALNVFLSTVTNDLDSNGKPEIWIGSDFFSSVYGSVTRLFVLETNGPDSYHKVYQIDIIGMFSWEYGNMRNADIDNDEKDEVLLYNTQHLIVFKRNQDGYFMDFVMSDPKSGVPIDRNGFDVTDLDDDGKLELVFFYHFLPDSNTIFMKRTNTVGVEDNIYYASEYRLFQNYPNPFNPSTKISYTLKEEGNVKLLIYDIKGELISTLVNERQQSGNYEVDFTLPGNISTGVYIYRLTVTDNSSRQVFADVKKMVYLK